MHIKGTPPQSQRPSLQPVQKKSGHEAVSTELPSAPDYGDGWTGTAFSVLGGLTTVAGTLTQKPELIMAGSLVTTAAMSTAAYRVQKTGQIDRAALANFAGGGTLMIAGALLTLHPPKAPQAPNLLPDLLRIFGPGF